MSERRGLFGLDWVPVAATALASVSSAVILSTLGASGTLIGAAVGSIVATISSAMYTRGLQTSREKVSVVFQSGGVSQVSPEEADRLEADGALADPAVSEAVLGPDAQAEDTYAPTIGERFRAINWRKVAPWTIATFVVVMAAITAFELIGGKPVSSLTGGSDGDGTSISRVVDRGNDRDGDKRRQPKDEPSDSGTPRAPDDETTPTEAPSADPSQTPSEEPSAPLGESPSAPVETETVTPEPQSETETVAPVE